MLKLGYPVRLIYLKILIGNKMNQYGLRQSKKYYKSICIEFSKVKNKKYIFFTPSFQPERSTNPDGNIYYEHYYALSMLSQYLPKDHIILYKEHPKSFDANTIDKSLNNLNWKTMYFDDVDKDITSESS